MTLLAALTLSLVMAALAAIPSASVALVITRSATHGVKNGSAVASGIVVGDLVFVTMAIFGMSFLAEAMGAFFAIFKYIGGAYLIWLGVGLIRSNQQVLLQSDCCRGSTLLTSFASGLVLTLGDVKAILFYASLFPAFVDMASLTVATIAIIVTITILVVGGVKLVYAFAAHSIVSRLERRHTKKCMRKTAGVLMIGAGTYLIVKA
ncbi:LysE family translocator [Luteolibacter sp. AS25]|uniref:LysE family translocator n=1 Tax=Luteolibacter sp. AS25 TaxID=3135776 RepID=UPI00398AD95E